MTGLEFVQCRQEVEVVVKVVGVTKSAATDRKVIVLKGPHN